MWGTEEESTRQPWRGSRGSSLYSVLDLAGSNMRVGQWSGHRTVCPPHLGSVFLPLPLCKANTRIRMGPVGASSFICPNICTGKYFFHSSYFGFGYEGELWWGREFAFNFINIIRHLKNFTMSMYYISNLKCQKMPSSTKALIISLREEN